jgi:hypothetical protein
MEASEVVWDGGRPLGAVGPDGDLTPILIDGLGDPVVAVWTSPQLDLRWYLVPDQTDWPTVIDWLAQQALPAYVPGALRRARSGRHLDKDLQTSKEVGARQALADLKGQYARDKEVLEQQLRSATKEATPVRNGLLYGTQRGTRRRGAQRAGCRRIRDTRPRRRTRRDEVSGPTRRPGRQPLHDRGEVSQPQCQRGPCGRPAKAHLDVADSPTRAAAPHPLRFDRQPPAPATSQRPLRTGLHQGRIHIGPSVPRTIDSAAFRLVAGIGLARDKERDPGIRPGRVRRTAHLLPTSNHKKSPLESQNAADCRGGEGNRENRRPKVDKPCQSSNQVTVRPARRQPHRAANPGVRRISRWRNGAWRRGDQRAQNRPASLLRRW